MPRIYYDPEFRKVFIVILKVSNLDYIKDFQVRFLFTLHLGLLISKHIDHKFS